MRYAIVCVLVAAAACQPQRTPGIEEMQRKRAERRAMRGQHGADATERAVAARQREKAALYPVEGGGRDPEATLAVDFGPSEIARTITGPFYCFPFEPGLVACEVTAKSCVEEAAYAERGSRAMGLVGDMKCEPKAEAWCFAQRRGIEGKSLSGVADVCMADRDGCVTISARDISVSNMVTSVDWPCTRVGVEDFKEAPAKIEIEAAEAALPKRLYYPHTQRRRSVMGVEVD